MVTFRIAVILGFTLALTACGFALRGSQQAAVSADTVLLQADESSALVQQLRDALEAVGVRPVDTLPASYQLAVGPEQSDTRTISVNGRARAAQYELQLAVEISLARDNTVLMEPEVVAVQRTYFEDTANIAGSNEERELLLDEMRTELVNSVIRRLAAATAPAA